MSEQVDRVRVWARRKREDAAAGTARRLPRQVRKWVVVNAAVDAREPDRLAGDYCGPDGLTYSDLYDHA